MHSWCASITDDGKMTKTVKSAQIYTNNAYKMLYLEQTWPLIHLRWKRLQCISQPWQWS